MEPLDVSIMVILGSENDFDKIGGRKGVEEKLEKMKETTPNFSASVSVISCHRNSLKLIDFCKNNKAKLWIAMAGKAAHLPGMIKAYLCAYKKSAHVVGVAISSENPDDYNAARLSITQIPDAPVDFMGFDEKGFDNALQFFKLMADKPVKEVKKKDPQINIIHV